MKRLSFVSLAGLALAACQTPEPKVAFPDEEVAKWAGSTSPDAVRLPALPPRPDAPFLAGEAVAPNQVLLASSGVIPASGASWQAVAISRRPLTKLAGSIHTATTKGAAPARSRGPALTRCADDRVLVEATAEGTSATGETPFVVFVHPSIGLAPLAPSSDAADQGARRLGEAYAGRRGAHLVFAHAVQLDGDPALEAIVGLSAPATRADCGVAVATETAFLDDDTGVISSEPSLGCLDEARERFCDETEDARHCDPNGLDQSGFAEVAPIPLGAATLREGGILLVEELRGDVLRSLQARLVRGREQLALGSVGFPATDAESGACR